MATEPNDQIVPTGDFNNVEPRGGLTKREYFAILFTVAFIQCPRNSQPNFVEENAEMGLKQADALINALNK